MADELLIEIDRAACLGAQMCVRSAPASFELDSENKARVREPVPDDEATLVAAARRCPNFAISIRRGNEQLA